MRMVAVLLVTTACSTPSAGVTPMTTSPPLQTVVSQSVLSGRVLDASGQPVAGALVSANLAYHPQIPQPGFVTFSDSEGRYQLSRLPPGRYGMTASTAAGGAAYAGISTIAGENQSPPTVDFSMADSRVVVKGSVRNENGEPIANARVLAMAFGPNENEIYVAQVDSRGHYQLTLPEHTKYSIAADAGPRPRSSRIIEPISQTVDFQLDRVPAPRPLDAEIVRWLGENATPFSSSKQLDNNGVDAFGRIVGGAPLVALGEATHGSAEFVHWRFRIFQTLVRDHGFTVYVAEVPWAEAWAVDDYVLRGEISAQDAIHTLNTWTVESEETLQLVEWMRTYNADPAHRSKLRFAGIDILTPRAVVLLREYLKQVDAPYLASISETLSPFEGLDSDSSYPVLPATERKRLAEAVTQIVATLDQNHARYASQTQQLSWVRARHCARMLEQATLSHGKYEVRDKYMFENLRWHFDHSVSGTKMVLAAHNSHVGAEQHDVQFLGKLLRNHWGKKYVSIGMAFNRGSLYALDYTGGDPNIRRNFEMGRAPAGTFDHDLSLAALPQFVVDLRPATGPMAEWLHSAQKLRSIGGGFTGPDDFEIFTPARAFDAILYVDQVTAIHPLKR